MESSTNFLGTVDLKFVTFNITLLGELHQMWVIIMVAELRGHSLRRNLLPIGLVTDL